MNDVIINWKKLKKFKGRHHGVVDDAPYRRDQIKTLIDNCALRDRAMILMNDFCWLAQRSIANPQAKRFTKDRKIQPL